MATIPGSFSTARLFSAVRCSPPLAQHSRKSYDFLVSCTLCSHASAVVVGPPQPPAGGKSKATSNELQPVNESCPFVITQKITHLTKLCLRQVQSD